MKVTKVTLTEKTPGRTYIYILSMVKHTTKIKPVNYAGSTYIQKCWWYV
jgi:hypothetical protein